MLTISLLIISIIIINIGFMYHLMKKTKKLKPVIKEVPIYIDEHIVVKSKMFEVSNLNIIQHDVVAHKVIINIETGVKTNYMVLKNNKEIYIDVPNIFYSEDLAKAYLEDKIIEEENRKLKELETKQQLALKKYEEDLEKINKEYLDKVSKLDPFFDKKGDNELVEKDKNTIEKDCTRVVKEEKIKKRVETIEIEPKFTYLSVEYFHKDVLMYNKNILYDMYKVRLFGSERIYYAILYTDLINFINNYDFSLIDKTIFLNKGLAKSDKFKEQVIYINRHDSIVTLSCIFKENDILYIILLDLKKITI